MRLIDIHCHVLPFVDDGPETLEEAIEILEESKRQGIRHMIVTPHYRREMFEPLKHQLIESFRMLQKEASARGMQIFLGCEYYRDSEIYEKIENAERPTMAGTPYVLVEFSVQDSFTYIRNFLYEMKIRGFQPIIAHVERYESCWSIEKIRELSDCGIKIQINAATVLGRHGWKDKRTCLDLMKEDLIDFIASDVHNMTNRSQNLEKCAEYVEKKMDAEYRKKIFYDNPANILRNR